MNVARSSKIPLLTGEIGVLEDSMNNMYYPQNNAVLINGTGEVVTTYPKVNLVPFGEWFPYKRWLPFINDLVVEFGGSNFVPGDGPVLFEIKGKKFGVMICYEGLFYRLCRKYKEIGADFLVNITNDGWTDYYSGHMQFFAPAKFRAIENGCWYIRAGNTGYSAIIDPYGRVTKSIPILKPGYLTGKVDLGLNHETFYSKWGDLILYAAGIFISLVIPTTMYSLSHNPSQSLQGAICFLQPAE